MATVYCKHCRYCEKDDVSSTRSEFRRGDEYDSCKNGED